MIKPPITWLLAITFYLISFFFFFLNYMVEDGKLQKTISLYLKKKSNKNTQYFKLIPYMDASLHQN